MVIFFPPTVSERLLLGIIIAKIQPILHLYKANLFVCTLCESSRSKLRKVHSLCTR